MNARRLAALMIISAALPPSNVHGRGLEAAISPDASADQPVTPAGDVSQGQPLPATASAIQPDGVQADGQPARPVELQGQGAETPSLVPADRQSPALPNIDQSASDPGSGASREAPSSTIIAAPSASASPIDDRSALDTTGETAAGVRDPLAPLGDPPQRTNIPSSEAWQVIDWVIATHDNNAMPFLVIDKIAAEVFAFEPDGQRIAASPALVGMTAGDETIPWVGDREMSNIRPRDRTTPAGRFVSNLGPAIGHRDVLWIDYPGAISLHPVISVNKQHRFERLRTRTPDDNRITYGCINVPGEFYAKVIKRLFKNTSGVVYILPDTKSLNEVFLAMPQSAQTQLPLGQPKAIPANSQSSSAPPRR